MNNARKTVLALMIALTGGITTAANSRADDSTSQPAATQTLDAVLVTGEQPGPGLWKVSKGDHVLWIFGTYAPLPKKMSWRSQQVEQVIADSQELILTVEVKPKIGFFRGIALLPSLIGMRNNPDNAKLKDVVPADVYARWLVLKQEYIGRDNGVEKRRPIFAAHELYDHAIDQWGFKTTNPIMPANELQDAIRKLAKKHHVKITTPIVAVEFDSPRAAIKTFKKLPVHDTDCFAAMVTSVETDRDAMRARANAWAVGNVAALRPKIHTTQLDACAGAFFEIMSLAAANERGLNNIPSRVVDTWVAAAEAALEKNTSTFAVLSIDDIFWQDGYVAKLKAKGYLVEEP